MSPTRRWQRDLDAEIGCGSDVPAGHAEPFTPDEIAALDESYHAGSPFGASVPASRFLATYARLAAERDLLARVLEAAKVSGIRFINLPLADQLDASNLIQRLRREKA